MNFRIVRTEEFSKHLKQLAKKYPSIKKDYDSLLISLLQNSFAGIFIRQKLLQNTLVD